MSGGLRASQIAKTPCVYARCICQGINSLVASGHALGVVSATWAAENTTLGSDKVLGSTISFSFHPGLHLLFVWGCFSTFLLHLEDAIQSLYFSMRSKA